MDDGRLFNSMRVYNVFISSVSTLFGKLLIIIPHCLVIENVFILLFFYGKYIPRQY